jgi:hypothetical protein
LEEGGNNKLNKPRYSKYFMKEFNVLDKGDELELSLLKEKLNEVLEKNLEEEVQLKKQVARFCLKVIDKTVEEGEDLTNTCYLLTGAFIWYDFKNELDEAFSIAGELELPEDHIEENPQELFREMKEIFERYLG